MMVWKLIQECVTFLANLVTITLGCTALWGLFKHRKRISQLIQVLLNSHTNDQVRRIRETLSKLEALDYELKEERKEVFALLGQVAGQIRSLVKQNDLLKEVHDELHLLLAKKAPVTEATKRRILSQLHAGVDAIAIESTQRILDPGK